MAVGILVDTFSSRSSVKGGALSIDLDVLSDEVHEWGNDVTTSQVETGSPISDHIQPLPDRITITGMITDSPLSEEAQNNFTGSVDGNTSVTRVQTAFDVVRLLFERRELLTVYTRYKIYTNMAFTGCNIPRSANVGEAVMFTMQLINVRLVSTQTVDVPPGISRKNEAKAGGANGPVAKKTQTQKKSGNVQNKKVDPDSSVAEVLLDKILGLKK